MSGYNWLNLFDTLVTLSKRRHFLTGGRMGEQYEQRSDQAIAVRRTISIFFTVTFQDPLTHRAGACGGRGNALWFEGVWRRRIADNWSLAHLCLLLHCTKVRYVLYCSTLLHSIALHCAHGFVCI